MSLKKLLAALTSLVLLVGIIGIHSSGTSYQKVMAKDTNPTFTVGGPVDLTIANEEKVIEMLKREGKIPQNATYEEAQKIYLTYMQEAAKANESLKPSEFDKQMMKKENQRVQKNKFDPSKPDTNPKKVNILVLLVEYSDFSHNNIMPDESDMYYKDYTHQHFQDMLFGENGYTGPNGENLISMKQYYAQQSGGSLDIEGTVAGWYKLPQSAAYYGYNVGGYQGNDVSPRNAVKDALKEAAKDPNLNLADFDKEDIFDMDGDGDYNEPDGIIDYLMVLHAGVGEEAGGGSLGSNAIWSHSWSLGKLYNIPGTSLYAYTYTIEPEDGATGVFAHEFGHNLGLPDEYDTVYSGPGEPISMWSIMSSGSWAGKIGGTEPSGFSPYGKQMFQELYGGNWQKQITIDFDKITSAGARVTLRQADEEGQVVRINLPDKKGPFLTKPTSGSYAYFSGVGNNLNNSMITSIDLTGLTDPKLTFKAWYDIEKGWDYASVQVKDESGEWRTIPGNITTEDNPHGQNPGYGITGTSNEWVDAEFDLVQYAGKKIELKFNYWTDGAAAQNGLYIDDIVVKSGDTVAFSDNSEGTTNFKFDGFAKRDGYLYTTNYYLVEWRNHHGVDKGLANIAVLGHTYSYDPGMLVWYVDNYYADNWTGEHPGEGYLGIVDADQHSIVWQYADSSIPPMLASSNQYLMHDAAFSKDKETEMNLDLTAYYGRTAVDTYRFTEPRFDDMMDYTNPEKPYAGRNIPHLGLTIEIANQANDNSSASIIIKKK